MKKIIAILICLFMIMSIVGCSSEVANKDVETENKETNDNEITIIMGVSEDGNEYEDKIYSNHMVAVKRELEKKSDIKVNIERMKTNTYEEYLQKRNMKLYLEDGPTLILIKADDRADNLIKQGVALKVDDKISNYKNIYSTLRDNYFIPISMKTEGLSLKKDVLKDLNIPLPDYNWTVEDLIEIQEKWVESRDIYFTGGQYHLSWKRIEAKYNIEYLDEEKMEFKIGNEKVLNFIKELRDEVFSGKYILPEGYTYENYYNFFNVFHHGKEWEELLEHVRKNNEIDFRERWWDHYSPLQTLEIKKNKKYKDDILIVQDHNRNMFTWGFIVNKNGKNLDKGLEYLNEFLSEDIQFEIFENYDYFLSSYPVISTIEDRIEEKEKEEKVPEDLINLRKHIVEEIKNGDYNGYKVYGELSESGNDNNLKIDSCYDKYYDLVFEIVFADTLYTDEEIMKKLKKLENKLNIMLNE